MPKLSETDQEWAKLKDRYFCPNDGSALARDDSGCSLFPGNEIWECRKCKYVRGWTAGVVDQQVN